MPRVDKVLGKNVLIGVSRAIAAGTVLSAHDCSEGGLAICAAEMAIAGRLGIRIDDRNGDESDPYGWVTILD